MLRSPSALAVMWLLSGCAHTHYYADDEGKTELPGLPFTWVDKDGNPRQAYVSTCTGFGKASFEIQRTEAGGYLRFSQNLDSTAAAELAGSLADKAFEAGKKAGAAEKQAEMEGLKMRIRQLLQSLPNDPARERALDDPALK